MNVTKLSSRFSAAGQITADDLADIAAAGFKSIINNRPDGEGGPEQPLTGDLAAVAAALGLVYLYVPVVSGSITQQNVEEFEKACENLESPTLLFCRSGARSTMLLNLATVA
jgi:uncharacterized protein (TIGR01244 family)